jgi:hypothetical protein
MPITHVSTNGSSILSAQDISIQFDPTKDAYIIGPHCNLPHNNVFRILKVIRYIPASMVYPMVAVWTPPTPTEPDTAATPAEATSGAATSDAATSGAATSGAATSGAACVRTDKVPKTANSFILYRRDKYAELCAQHPDSPNMSHKEFCKKIGNTLFQHKLTSHSKHS